MPAIGLLSLELHIHAAQSLKDKRQIVRSLKDRIRRQFNVSVAEVGHQSTHQLCTVAVVAVASNSSVGNGPDPTRVVYALVMPRM